MNEGCRWKKKLTLNDYFDGADLKRLESGGANKK
jgi:hypothetical protein